jgi:phosphomannomutase
MAPKFGTSGLRGLVSELTCDFVQDYTRAFLTGCETSDVFYVGRDLRPSSPQIADWVMEEALRHGLRVRDCGALPTPALALAAKGACAIMVTGSHIPADRNGLKFYVPSGEISKPDEEAISAARGSSVPIGAAGTKDRYDAGAAFLARYTQAYGAEALSGMRVGIYQHSSVARDMLMDVITALSGTPVAIARSDTFIPVDTEAVDPETQALFVRWIEEHSLDVLLSTDGDADRPMVVDHRARVVPGDVLGTLTAQELGAEVICTPVSSNSQVDELFDQVLRTRIGSPYVIAGMEEALASDSTAKVIGYEANGGFLLGFAAACPQGALEALMTRDCVLPMIAPLTAAQAAGQTLAAQVDAMPARFTAADRLQGIDTQASAAFLAGLRSDSSTREAFFSAMPAETGCDLTDGLRVTFAGGDVVHLRPSGNAPEFRCYTEAASLKAARALLNVHLQELRARLENS